MTKQVINLTPDEFTGWLAALRSGEYAHGRAALCGLSEDGKPTYCCLGVLQELYDFESSNDEGGYLNGDEDYGDVHIGMQHQRILAKLNDRLGNEKEAEKSWSHVPEEYQGQGDGRPVFQQVADYIEQHYEPRSRVI